MTDDDSALTLRIVRGPHHVSTLSSLLRSLQAAVREAAADTDAGAAFRDRSGPSLMAEIDAHPDGGAAVRFRFVNADGSPAPGVSSSSFAAFLSRVETALATLPQRTLWGTTVRMGGSSPAGSERIRQFLEDLTRLEDASVEIGRRRIELREGALWVGN